MTCDVRFITNITKEYPDMYRITVYKDPVMCKMGCSHVKRDKKEVNLDEYIPSIHSINRTKMLVRDIVLCNDFDLFCTFTFDPKKDVNVFNLMSCWFKIDRFLSHQRERSNSHNRELKYLIIPEQHKSGAWHFHALLSGFAGVLRDSGHMTATGRPIYNITSYRAGFSTATPIDDKTVVANYITKYITKDLIKAFNQRRFFCSRNLVRPKKTINSSVFRNSMPISRRKVSETKYCQFYEIPNDCQIW